MYCLICESMINHHRKFITLVSSGPTERKKKRMWLLIFGDSKSMLDECTESSPLTGKSMRNQFLECCWEMEGHDPSFMGKFS